MRRSRNCLMIHFNSRPPHGGRPMTPDHQNTIRSLQLTTSTRRSTALRYRNIFYRNTSTHDLHTEVDILSSTSGTARLPSPPDLHTEVDYKYPAYRCRYGALQPPTSTRRSTSGVNAIVNAVKLQLTTSTRRSTRSGFLPLFFLKLQLTTSTRRST